MEQEIASDFRSGVGKLSDTARHRHRNYSLARAPWILLRRMGVNFSSMGNYRVDVKKNALRVRRFAREGVLYRVLGIKERAASMAMQVIVIPGWRETHQFWISSLLRGMQLRLCACRAKNEVLCVLFCCVAPKLMNNFGHIFSVANNVFPVFTAVALL
jgi:hypothetical protein